MSLFMQFPKAVISAFSSSHCWADLVLVVIVAVRAATMGCTKEGRTEPGSFTCEPTLILCPQLWEFSSEL